MHRVKLRRISLRRTASTSLLAAVLAPRDDGTLDHFLTYGQGVPSFGRDSSGLVRDWEGIYQSIAAGTPRWQGARYSFDNAVAHWKLADGTALHPTRTVSHEGVDLLIFDHYQTRANSTAYTLGTRFIPATGDGTAGGNGFWYEVTVAGTSGASPPTFPTTVDATVADGTATLRCGGFYRIDGVVIEPTRTNLLKDSSLPAGSANWTGTTFDSTVAVDSIIDGATSQTRTHTANGAALEQAAGVFSAGRETFSVIIEQGVCVRTRLSIRDLTASLFYHNNFVWATKTFSSSLEGFEYFVTDLGIGPNGGATVLIGISYQLPAGNTRRTFIYPYGFDGTGSQSLTIHHAQLEETGGAPSSPIVTAGGAVTRDADTLTVPKTGNFNDTSGILIADYRPANWPAPAGYITGDAASYVLAPSATDSGAKAYDGTNTALGPAGTPSNMVRASAQWGTGVMSVSVNGTVGAETAYDGSFGLTDLKIGSGFQGAIRNVRILQ